MMIITVQSKSWAMDLAEQLVRNLRQVNPMVSELSGYYFPTGYFLERHIEKVSCVWDDRRIEIVITSHRTSFPTVSALMRLVYTKQIDDFSAAAIAENNSICCPVSSSFDNFFRH